MTKMTYFVIAMIEQYNYKQMFVTLALAFSLLGCESERREINSPGAGDNWIFTKFSGDNQSVFQYDTLSQRLTVQLKKLNDTAITDENILFELIYGSGNVLKPAGGNDYFDLLTFTDFEGKASAQFLNFGGDSLGVSRVSATVVSDTSLVVIFTITTK
ncbi:MAG: hypothetical protein IH931_07620 [candidate division Zixibacteria bacterium]|nr:hypothetical protein [candidate division Zixibacteria bacterium]